MGDVLATMLQTSLAQNVVLAQADLVTAQQNLDNLLKFEYRELPGTVEPGECPEKF